MIRCVILFCAFALLTSAALGHHGWGSYDASKPVTVTGPIVTAKFENLDSRTWLSAQQWARHVGIAEGTAARYFALGIGPRSVLIGNGRRA